jgi:EpsI family protein
MTIARLLILQGLLACGLGTIFFIPRETRIQPCRVRMELPDMIGIWMGRPAEVTQKERDILAKDTEFCRSMYDNGFGDQIYVSIVLSGNDLDNSIHRPERCLPAQGWTILNSNAVTLPVAAAPGGQLPVTRLYDVREEPGPNGQVEKRYNVNYYWFIGYSNITASHFQREFIDMKDRLFHGYNQRWAYVTVSATVTRDFRPDGMDEAGTDKMLQKIIAQVYPLIVTDAGSLKVEK